MTIFLFFLKLHQENECPAYPVVSDKCSKEGIPRGKVRMGIFPERICDRSRGATPSSQRVPDTEGSLPNTDIIRRLTNLENNLVENNRTTVETSRQVETTQETARRTERRMEYIEHLLALRNVILADLEEYVRQLELSSYDGQLIWKITEFARRRNEAVSGQQVSFYSPCFFTSRSGYKMCARIYLNGDGMGRGTHISVFLVIMRGQYDALLRWPFRQKVTFMLMDQDNVEHVIDAFRPDPSSSSFQRPRRESNIASGFPMFCSLTELNNHAYVRDDTMFLKVVVDTADIVENPVSLYCSIYLARVQCINI